MKESTFRFQPIQEQNALSNELRSVIRDNVLQFYMQGQTQEPQEEGITALYERLSQEDKLEGESNSIANQKKFWNAIAAITGLPLIVTTTRTTGILGRISTAPAFNGCLLTSRRGRSSASS